MELTKTQAIELTIEVWEKLAKSGDKHKSELVPSGILHRCYLCGYADQLAHIEVSGTHIYPSDRCIRCPWHKYMGHCEDDNSPYDKWADSSYPYRRRIWATHCLERLYAIRELEADNPQIPLP